VYTVTNKALEILHQSANNLKAQVNENERNVVHCQNQLAYASKTLTTAQLELIEVEAAIKQLEKQDATQSKKTTSKRNSSN